VTARLVRLLARVLPGYGRHRARRGVPGPVRGAAPEAPRARRPRRPLPLHRSPYAREAAEAGPFMDEASPVRPYLANWAGTGGSAGPDGAERRAQAERRWVLDMALRGFDAGPAVIHGVYVRSDGGPRAHRPPVVA
jgi:hypothetical protein